MADKYPAEWLKRIRAEVFAHLLPGEIRILLHPGLGIAHGGAPHDIPIELVPPELRMPHASMGRSG